MRTRKGMLLVLVGIAVAVCASNGIALAAASVPVKCYLTIPNVTGDGPGGQIVVYGLNHTITLPTSGINPSGKSVHQPLAIVKKIDSASPFLYKAVCLGTHFPTVTLNFPTNSKSGAAYFSVELKNVLVVGTRTWIPDILDKNSAGFGHMEDVSFIYGDIKWSDAKGNAFEFNVLTNAGQ
jgi:type VI secretion system secreted protein Hcp